MTGIAPKNDIPSDFTSQISKALELGHPCTSGSFGVVYRCTIKTSKGTVEVAVKVFKIDPGRAMEKNEKAMRRELKVWLRLSKHKTIVPLLGIAYVGSPLPALISKWMPSGTLYMHLEQGTITASAKADLVMDVADGLKYLHSENVVHGDLHPVCPVVSMCDVALIHILQANVLVDGSGHTRLTDFGLATVAGDAELQLSVTSATRSLDPRWRAPEVIGIKSDPEPPTFESDIYSFGGVMFFVMSGDVPWKDKKLSHQIVIQLAEGANPARPDNIPDHHWNVIQKCWSWDPVGRPKAAEVLEFIVGPTLALAEDLTGQVFGTIYDYVASGSTGNVYRCEWRRPSGPVKVWPVVAVKVLRHHTNHISEQDLRRFRRETAIWAHLVHDNIVTLYGTTEGFGPTTALVSRWFPHGTLFRLITEQGATLTIRSKLKLLHDIASGLYYLHSFPIVHGDITSSNVLVDLKDGEYKACLTDFCLSNVLGGFFDDPATEGSDVRPGAVRWTAPELLRPYDPPSDIKPTTHNDMYSFGCVMFHLLTLVIPWHGIYEYRVVQKILSGEDIPRPEISEATSDVTDARWNQIEQCWSVDPSARPCAFTAMSFIKGELEALKQDVIASVPLRGGVQSQAEIPTAPPFQSSSRTLIPSRPATPSSPLTYHSFSTVSSLVLSMYYFSAKLESGKPPSST
ncbi:kinase-like domain-containing protein [Suillus lakei]|nr:kinase-like domain-containing protein [Suillus lakei]